MTTRVLTLAGICYVVDDVCNNNGNFHWKYVHFKEDKIVFKKSYDKRNLLKGILHEWSFKSKRNLARVVISYEIY